MTTIKQHHRRYSLPLSLALCALLWAAIPNMASSAMQAEHNSEEHHDDEARIVLTPEQITRAALSFERAGPAAINQTLPLYGTIVPNAEREHSVSARYPGVIQQVTKQVGDPVKVGEPLLTVESNASLKAYSIPATLSGVVSQRNANAGEQTGERVLFVLGDYSTVWVNLAVFPRDLPRLHVGQAVRITQGDQAGFGEGTIVAISPVGNSASQTTTARVLLDNPDRRWVPGHLVNAEVILTATTVPIAIRNEAVQTVDDEVVVFVAADAGFEARAVTLGRGDGEFNEVLAGLAAGEQYVVNNSFTLKSELGKEGAEHEH